MSGHTRRNFLSLAGAGTAVGVASFVAPNAADAAEDDTLPADAQGSMVAYIHDLRKGEVALMVEGDEVIVTDRKLAARMARAFTNAKKG